MNIALFLLASSSPVPLPTALLESYGYKMRQRPVSRPLPLPQGDYREDETFESVEGSHVRVVVHWHAADKRNGGFSSRGLTIREQEGLLNRQLSAVADLGQLPSGLPPDLVRLYKGTGLCVTMLTGEGFVSVDFTPRIGATSKGFANPEPYDYSIIAPMLERILRHTMARTSGFRLEERGLGTVAGITAKRSRCLRTGLTYGALRDWASRKGWSAEEDGRYGVIHLKRGSQWAVVPLASSKIKVNGLWKEMGDDAAIFNGSVCIPEAGLNHLKALD
jgi:hypothetical protein